MSKCDTCGNKYEKSFDIHIAGETYTFDSFECAIHKLAPRCKQCECRIIGHGLEAGDDIYCCDHCAEKDGVTELTDSV